MSDLPQRIPGKALLEETAEIDMRKVFAELDEWDSRALEDETKLLDEGASRAYIDKVSRRVALNTTGEGYDDCEPYRA